MNELPEIHEIGKLTLEPGDILVLRNHEVEINRDQAEEIEMMVRMKLGLGADFRFLVLGRDWKVEAATGLE
jgi:hypothetical protein